MTPMTKLVELRNVYKIYAEGLESEVRALDGVSLEIERGEFVAVVGQSGSGKSTMMNVLGCLDVPTRGDYYLNGTDVRELTDRELSRIRNKEIGFIFQSYHLLPEFTILENVAIAGTLGGKSWKNAKDKALTLLTAVGLENRINHRPSELSGGEQQRAAIARALVNDPELILADEPTGNLDGKTGDEILSLLQDIRKSRPDCSILMITHNREISKLANQTIEIKDGIII